MPSKISAEPINFFHTLSADSVFKINNFKVQLHASKSDSVCDTTSSVEVNSELISEPEVEVVTESETNLYKNYVA